MSRFRMALLLLFLFFISCSDSEKEIYEPTWESLSNYHEAPRWFRDAKFGIWAHWGPQCQPGQGDWYGKGMYIEGSDQYKWHIENYGHPSVAGFKEVIHSWKAEKWNPEKLVSFYKKVGAKYFMAMANHHDNFDLWDSQYHKWNSVNLGPHKNILAEWANASRQNNLPFGVSIHSSHAWTWYETAQGFDERGEYEGIPYDGVLTKEEGVGLWWDGYDPQELYAQNHPLSEEYRGGQGQWNWQDGASIPTKDYIESFYNRNIDVIDQFSPDLIYYDDTTLPFWPIDEVGLHIVSYLYNKSIKENQGENKAVVFGKVLQENQKEAIVWDVEKGVPNDIQEKPWQTCTCLGGWHYNEDFYVNKWYKDANTVIHMLIDIISKNGNLLLSVPMRGDGSIDDQCELILNQVAEWMAINNEAIYSTRPWTIYGEGPSTDKVNPLTDQGFNEGKHEPYTAEDIRFVVKDGVLYAHVLAWPKDHQLIIKALSSSNPYFGEEIKDVQLLGSSQKPLFSQEVEGLIVDLTSCNKPNKISFVLKITK